MTAVSPNRQTRRFDWVLWAGLLLLLSTICLAFLLAHFRLRAFLGKPLDVYGQVADFSLTNQLGQSVRLDNLRGHVWVADLIFTRCAGPCLKMSRQMKRLQDLVPASSSARLVTITTDPAYDTPAVLKTYGERFGANPARWEFLTGSKKEITNLAVNSLKLTALEKDPAQRETPVDLFIHSTIFVIVDKRGQLRGIFETTGDAIDPQKVENQIRAAIRRLERES